MTNLATRVKEAVDSAKDRGVSVGDIAAVCDVSVQSVYQWMKNGERKEIEGTKLVELAAITGYSALWIMKGKGNKIEFNLDSEEAEIIRQYRSMQAHERAKWRILWMVAKDGATDERVGQTIRPAPKPNKHKGEKQ